MPLTSHVTMNAVEPIKEETLFSRQNSTKFKVSIMHFNRIGEKRRLDSNLQ